MRSLVLTIIATAALAASPAMAGEKAAPEDALAKLLEGRVAGEPRKCISLSHSPSTQIIDQTAIVYRIGNTLWVNRPRSGAESLDEDDILVTRTIGSQLCSIDSVQLHDRSGYFWRGFVSLGDFIPYRKVETAAIE